MLMKPVQLDILGYGSACKGDSSIVRLQLGSPISTETSQDEVFGSRRIGASNIAIQPKVWAG